MGPDFALQLSISSLTKSFLKQALPSGKNHAGLRGVPGEGRCPEWVWMGGEDLSRQSSQGSSEGTVRCLMSCSERDSLRPKKMRQGFIAGHGNRAG